MAATDLERLVVQLSADIKGYENALKKAQGTTNRQLGAIQKKALSTSSAMSGAFLKAGTQIAGAFLASELVRNFAQLSDAATRITNSLKVAGLSGKDLETVYERLNDAALANGAPIETLAALYGKAALSQKELGVSTEELTLFTNNVALALRVAGTSSQAASGALLQLGQALGGGIVRAEEFNSILEGAPTIAQAAAAGLKEAGGSVARLRALVIDGKISSEAFFRAFEAGAPMLEEKVAGSVFTLDQATTNLWTALTRVTKEFNESTGASERFTRGINATAGAINSFDISGLVEKVRGAKAALDDYLGTLGNAQIFKDLNQALGSTGADGSVINVDATAAKNETASLEKEVKLLQERIKLNTGLGFDNTEALQRLTEVQQKLAVVKAAAANLPDTVDGYKVTDQGVLPDLGGTNGQMGGSSTRGGARRNPVVPVSVDDFKPPASPKKSGSGKSKTDDYARELQQLKDRTSALQAQTEAQSGLNPLVDDYGFAVEKAAAKHDLLTAAQEAGKKVTPELAAQIDTLSTAYANAVVASEKLAESQDLIREKAEEARDFNKDLTRGVIDGFRQSKDAADIFADALSKISDRLLDMALNSVFDAPSKGGMGFDLFGAIGSIFKREKGGPVRKGQPYIVGEKRPEVFVPSQSGTILPKVPTAPSMPSAAQMAGGRSANMNIDARTTIQASGNRETDAELMRWAAKRDAELPSKIIKVVKDAQKRRQI
jgi:tape measure domain-containing protein